MSEDEIKNERPDMIVNLVENVLEFNNQNQRGQGLKILIRDQMLRSIKSRK